MKLIPLMVILFLGPLSSTGQAQTHIDYYNKSIEAYKAGDYKSFLSATQKADSLRPNHPALLYNLANGFALNRMYSEAIRTLNYRSHFYASKDFVKDEDFDSLKNLAEWDTLLLDVNRQNAPFNISKQAFELNKTGFHPEGIEYNKTTGEFYLSDVHTGIVYRCSQAGENLQPLIDLKDFGYWSALGMAVDANNTNHLWVTTAAFQNFSGYEESFEGKSAVLLFEISSGKLLEWYEGEEDAHVFGDILVSKKGDVYVTDSVSPVIYLVDRESAQLKKVFTYAAWWNLQGLAFSENEKWLYVSDYITGIYKIDILTREIKPVLKENEWLRGGDGIYVSGNRLVVLQNGTQPKRVAMIELDKQGFGMKETLQFPHQANENLEEPTLGTWVKGDLYYIGNSPWGYYDENYQAKEYEWPSVKVFRLTVD